VSSDVAKTAARPAPKVVKAIASVVPNAAEIVGPPPNLTKADASPQKRRQKLNTHAASAPMLVNAAASPQPKLLKGATSTPAEFVPPQSNSTTTKPPSTTPASAVALPSPTPEAEVKLVVSVRDQKLAVVVNGQIYRTYKVSTSRYGEGDNFGSWQTPLGHLQVATKIGGAAPAGAVFHRRQPTGARLAGR